MKEYRYVAKNNRGISIKGSYSCNSYQDLKKYIRDKNFFIIKCKAINNKRMVLTNFISIKQICLFLNMFSVLLKCGLSIINSLEIIISQNINKTLKYSIENIKKDINKGMNLNESMYNYRNIFPDFMIHMIKVGEESGKLDKVLENLYEYYTELHNNKRKLKSALIYPLITFIVSICVSTFFVLNIIPVINEIIISSGGNIPYITKIFIKFYYVFIIVIIVSVIIFIIIKYITCNKNIYLIDTLKYKIPLINKLHIRRQEINFIESFFILIDSGININYTFEIIADITDDLFLKRQYINVLKNLNKGVGISRSISNVTILQPFVLSMISSGEESGNLDMTLKRIHIIIQNEYKNTCEKMISLIEPVSIIVISILIGFIIISVLLPIVNISTSISM